MTEPEANARAVIALSGADRVKFLQGILTQDVSKLAAEKIQFAALLSPQGKILHDLFLIADGDRILIDTPAMYHATLLKRLAMYKLRAAVTIEAAPELHAYYSRNAGLADPRHPALPWRIYSETPPEGALISSTEYRAMTLALGIPDSAVDFVPDALVALDAGYDLLNAISFTKGCYVGQEVTARMHYKNIARRGFYILERDGAPVCLSLEKFETVETAKGNITRDGESFTARLPDWMQPKFVQYLATP